jgi:hypothetical protein
MTVYKKRDFVIYTKLLTVPRQILIHLPKRMGSLLWNWVLEDIISTIGFMDSKAVANDSTQKLEENQKAPQGAKKKEMER